MRGELQESIVYTIPTETLKERYSQRPEMEDELATIMITTVAVDPSVQRNICAKREN